MALVLKVQYNDTLRRFGIPPNPQWRTIVEFIRTIFTIPSSQTVDLKYTDPEGDLVTISSDVELEEAIAITSQTDGIRILRLKLSIVGEPNEISHTESQQVHAEPEDEKTPNLRPPLDPLAFVNQFYTATVAQVQANPLVDQLLRKENLERYLRGLNSQELAAQIQSFMKPENFLFFTQYLTQENFNHMVQAFCNTSAATATAATNFFNHLCPNVNAQPKPNQPSQNSSQNSTTNSTGPAQNFPGVNFASLFQNMMTPQNLANIANLSAAFQPKPQNNMPETGSTPCKNSSQNTCQNSAQNDPHNPFGALFQNLITPQNLAFVQQNMSHACNMFSEGIKTTFNQNMPKPPQNTTQVPVQTPVQVPVPPKEEIPVQSPIQIPVQTPVEVPVQNEEIPENNELFRQHLQIMYDMGFTNTHLNEEILGKFNGNLEQAIQFVIDVSF